MFLALFDLVANLVRLALVDNLGKGEGKARKELVNILVPIVIGGAT